jgi:predicted small lipoprotein YifL
MDSKESIMNRRYWLLLTLTVFLALALAACGGKGSGTAPAKETSAPSAQATAPESPAEAKPTAASAKKTAVPAAQSTEAPAATPEEDSLSLASRDTGLDQLSSYRATWHAEWKSTDQGKTDQGTWNWTEEYTSDPKARHLSMQTPDSNDSTKTSTFEMWQIGDTTYMKSGEDQQCLSFSSEGSEKDIQQGGFSPSMLGGIEDAKYVGRDTVNGVPTKHYKYNSKAGMLATLGEVSGETWVATDGGYVVKDSVTWKGGGGLFGLGSSTTAKGEGSWTWELLDVNKPIEITPPEGCGGSQLALPIMPDATEKSRFGNMTSYKTAGAVSDVAAFYKDKLAADGWSPEGEPTEMGDAVILNFAKDSQKLNVMITASDGTTQVILNVGE